MIDLDVILPLDQLRGLGRGLPRDPGLYFLWRGPQLLYIGSAMTDLHERIFYHRDVKLGLRRSGTKYPYTHHTCMSQRREGLQQMEYRYIERYRPPFNPSTKYTGFGPRCTFAASVPEVTRGAIR